MQPLQSRELSWPCAVAAASTCSLPGAGRVGGGWPPLFLKFAFAAVHADVTFGVVNCLSGATVASS